MRKLATVFSQRHALVSCIYANRLKILLGFYKGTNRICCDICYGLLCEINEFNRDHDSKKFLLTIIIILTSHSQCVSG
jgi:hypothetical protein